MANHDALTVGALRKARAAVRLAARAYYAAGLAEGCRLVVDFCDAKACVAETLALGFTKVCDLDVAYRLVHKWADDARKEVAA